MEKRHTHYLVLLNVQGIKRNYPSIRKHVDDKVLEIFYNYNPATLKLIINNDIEYVFIPSIDIVLYNNYYKCISQPIIIGPFYGGKSFEFIRLLNEGGVYYSFLSNKTIAYYIKNKNVWRYKRLLIGSQISSSIVKKCTYTLHYPVKNSALIYYGKSKFFIKFRYHIDLIRSLLRLDIFLPHKQKLRMDLVEIEPNDKEWCLNSCKELYLYISLNYLVSDMKNQISNNIVKALSLLINKGLLNKTIEYFMENHRLPPRVVGIIESKSGSPVLFWDFLKRNLKSIIDILRRDIYRGV